MSDASRPALSFLTQASRRGRPEQPEYRVMVFEPRGYYPRGTQRVPNAFFHADEQIVFSVVLGENWGAHDPELPFSEFDWASPQELRLIASLLLCENMDQGYIFLYPIVRFSPLVDAKHLDLSADATVNEVRALLLAHIASAPMLAHEYAPLRACSANPYSIVAPEDFAFDRLMTFWNALATPNYVLLRGMYALMKSDMLSRHYEFCEESVLSLHIALDASFALIQRRLRADGKPNPSAHDAAVWLHSNFNEPFGHDAPVATDRYFHEFYEQRVMAMHPSSRFGDLPYSPTMHDDIVYLRRWLRQIFAFLLIGQHDAGFLEAVREHQSRWSPKA